MTNYTFTSLPQDAFRITVLVYILYSIRCHVLVFQSFITIVVFVAPGITLVLVFFYMATCTGHIGSE